MISVNEAWELLKTHAPPRADSTLELQNCAGHSLRQDLAADRDYPPFDRVAMDGYAFSHASWKAGRRQFFIQETQTAGQEPVRLKAGELCVEIMTGAKLPQGCDVVVRYEDTRREGADVFLDAALNLEPFANVHRQGDDCREGQTFSPPRVTPPVAAIAASFGFASLRVRKPFRISIIGTGDELVAIEEKPRDYQIRSSNIHALRMAMTQRGHAVVFCQSLRDDRALIHATVRQALENSDIILLSGAVSAGTADFVPSVLSDLQVTKIFHKIAQKPGKPLWFGQNEKGVSVFGLPGNPVSSLICAYRYVLPYLENGEGERPYAELLTKRSGPRKLTQFPAVSVRFTKDGRIVAEAVAHQGSGDFVSLNGTQGFLEIPGEQEPGFDPEQKHFPLYLW